MRRIDSTQLYPSKLTFSANLAENWFTTYLRPFQREVVKGHNDDDFRVRIAILDTGIDEEHEIFQELRQVGRIQGNGFPSSLLPFEDKDGHGTHNTSVLLRTAPSAELFIARIFDNQGKMVTKNNYEAVVQVYLFDYHV